jgi:hypothetical protein
MVEISDIQQEIAQLEKQLAEKRSALERDGVKQEKLLSDKKILHEIISEKIKEQIPQYQSTSPDQTPSIKPQRDHNIQSYVLPELKDKVQELVNTVFNESLSKGIKEALKTKNYALIDAFHDVLVDELFNALLERKKIKEVR